MTLLLRILLIATLLLIACKKKDSPDDPQPEPPVNPETPVDTTNFKCSDLPPVPVPFGWTDTTANPDNNVRCFFYNPLNNDEVIAVVEGDAFGFNKMVNYNLRTKARLTLASLDQFLPSINAKGWIVYSGADNNIYLIKANGDSLRKITNLSIAHDPKWNAAGNYFYFLQDAYLNVPAKLIKSDVAGNEVFSLPHGNALSAALRKSNKVVLQKIGSSQITLVLTDESTQAETELLKGPFVAGAPHFNFLTTDHNDENLYWSNKSGIFKWNFATKKTDTVFKNCENAIYDCPVISHKANEITYSVHTIKPIYTYFLLHEFSAMEMNTSTQEKRLIRIFK